MKCHHRFLIESIDMIDMGSLKGTAKCSKCGFTVPFNDVEWWDVISALNEQIRSGDLTLYVDYDEYDEEEYFAEIEEEED